MSTDVSATPLLCHGQDVLALSSQPVLKSSQHAQRLFVVMSLEGSSCLRWVPATVRGSSWLVVLDMLTCSEQRKCSSS